MSGDAPTPSKSTAVEWHPAMMRAASKRMDVCCYLNARMLRTQIQGSAPPTRVRDCIRMVMLLQCRTVSSIAGNGRRNDNLAHDVELEATS